MRFAVVALLLAVAGCGSEQTTAPTAPVASSVAPTPHTTRSASAAEQRSASRLITLPRTAGVWPGPNGLSGVNGDPTFDTAHVEAFCAARGRACRLAQTYTDRTSYESMTSGSGWTFEFFSDFDGALVISQGLVPTGGEEMLAGCAAGDYDTQWRNFGELMVEQGRGDSIVRLGWEMNERTMAWRATDTAAYIGCYRHAATAVRAANPDVVLDWSINAHGSPDGLCGGLATNCYPGDEYVDIIGIDNYDHYPWSPTKAAFDRTALAPEGLTWLYDFARAHSKPFSVGEWGVVPTGDAGKENPSFIRWMHEWFAARAPYLAYEAYFSDCGQGGVQSSLFRTDSACTKNPSSAAVYRSLWAE
ncbi:glycosyl hydrolase [Actinoplanes sp. NPDC051633]|uniref:glycoside hydrolase family 26 protein n=1 Tax=Actinoplanes sp. NPDC051633 TaxID=3155670 RepID=UPI00341C823F